MSGSGKGKHPKSAIRLDDLAEVNRLGIGDPDDRGGMKALADHEPRRQRLMTRFSGQNRGTVARRRARGITAVPDEIALGRSRIERFAVSLCRRKHRGPFAVELDQFLGDRPALRGIAMEEARRAAL